MLPARSNTADSLATLRDDNLNNVDSSRSTPIQVSPHAFERQWSNPFLTALSPPPVGKASQRQPLSPPPPPPQLQPQHKTSHFRLRSDSGFALHTNHTAFRQYTGYNPDGSLPSRPGTSRALSFEEYSSEEEFPAPLRPNTKLNGLLSHGTVLPDFFEPNLIKLAFSNPETGQRLRKFAETRHGGAGIDFLLKVSLPACRCPP